MALKRPEGVKIKDVTFTKRMLTKLLIEAGIATVTQVANLWREGEETDAQNVDAAMKLVLAIASFREKSVKDFPQSGQTPAFTSIFKELVLLAEYSGLWFEVIGQQSSRTMRSGYIPLAEVTAAAVDLSHLAFVLYRHNRSAFQPALLQYSEARALEVCEHGDSHQHRPGPLLLVPGC